MGILSRGYRGSDGTSDEIEVLKGRLGDRVAFGVGPDRYVEGRRIESEQQIDVFLLDDGFQHLQLVRDADIVLLDSTTCPSKGWLLPAGNLREPLSALRRASAVVLTRVQDPSRDPASIHAIQKVAGSHSVISIQGLDEESIQRGVSSKNVHDSGETENGHSRRRPGNGNDVVIGRAYQDDGVSRVVG